MNEIQITNDLKIDYDDLMKVVDPKHPFTLANILKICVSSKIPFMDLQQIIHCNYLSELWKEFCDNSFKDDGEVEYLEVFFSIIKFEKNESESFWQFCGVGYDGKVPKDLKEVGYKNESSNYRQGYNLSLVPMYKMGNYQIKIGEEAYFTDWTSKAQNITKVIKAQPSVTLVALLESIFFELGMYGSPEERNKQIKILEKRVDEVKLKNALGTEAVEKILKSGGKFDGESVLEKKVKHPSQIPNDPPSKITHMKAKSKLVHPHLTEQKEDNDKGEKLLDFDEQ